MGHLRKLSFILLVTILPVLAMPTFLDLNNLGEGVRGPIPGLEVGAGLDAGLDAGGNVGVSATGGDVGLSAEAGGSLSKSIHIDKHIIPPPAVIVFPPPPIPIPPEPFIPSHTTTTTTPRPFVPPPYVPPPYTPPAYVPPPYTPPAYYPPPYTPPAYVPQPSTPYYNEDHYQTNNIRPPPSQRDYTHPPRREYAHPPSHREYPHPPPPQQRPYHNNDNNYNHYRRDISSREKKPEEFKVADIAGVNFSNLTPQQKVQVQQLWKIFSPQFLKLQQQLNNTNKGSRMSDF